MSEAKSPTLHPDAEKKSECEKAENRDPHTNGHSESENTPRVTFAEWLRLLESCPETLGLECQASKGLLDFDRASTALRLWRERGFPNPKEPPEIWRSQVPTYVSQWVELFLAV